MDSPLRIVQITPGAGKMYCGACLRDNALVTALRRMGHSVVMAPLYLPLTLDEEDQTAGSPVFFSGINVYLDQQSASFRHAPSWLHRLLAARPLLEMASGAAGRTNVADLGDLTLSMLRGEEGNQARELDDLIAWLRVEKPAVVCLSNALLSGLARRMRAELRLPVVCTLQGEDFFLDSLPEPHRGEAWRTMAERAADVDLFIAPSRYFAAFMAKRLQLPSARIRIIPNGINLDGYDRAATASAQPGPPVLGYFARMCREKGMDQLVEAFIRLKKREGLSDLKLRLGGSCGPMDRPFVATARQALAAAGVLADVDFSPNVSREEKLAFFQTLSVFSVPATYGEAFGLFVIEALASGVPVVQPDHGAFGELVAATGGGVLCKPDDPEALAGALEALLRAPERARALGGAGQAAVRERFTVDIMAQAVAAICQEAVRNFPS
ncbi:MAG: glycosyltransferase family 4 protein [Limisphaerales bacterium]